MDGMGNRADTDCNAVAESGTPNLNRLKAKYPYTEIGASALDVGLPKGQIGNSEVGHLNIGAGRVVYQDITKIDKSIADGDFFTNEALYGAVKNAVDNDKKLHLIGLLSDGGVHSHIEHLFAILELAARNGLKKVFIHGLMDGRDVSPTSGVNFVRQTLDKTRELGVGKIASLTGRYYFMDRDNRWERVEEGYNCITAGKGAISNDPVKVMSDSYANGITDEFIRPTAITVDGVYEGAVDAGDSLIFFNFRSDRAREGTRAFIEPDFKEFTRVRGYTPLYYVCLTQYHADFQGVKVAYGPRDLKNTLGQYVAGKGLNQVRIAETEKYAHVTFFFNGGVEQPNLNESRVLINSPKVATYDLKPEMSAYEVFDAALNEVEQGNQDVMIINFANCDMVGHSGVFDATVKAVNTVDECVGKLVDAILAKGGTAIITADHGNAEQLCYEDGSPCTAHTTNLVPCILADDARIGAKLRSGGRLCDLAPTLLDQMGLSKPVEMDGESLIINS